MDLQVRFQYGLYNPLYYHITKTSWQNRRGILDKHCGSDLEHGVESDTGYEPPNIDRRLAGGNDYTLSRYVNGHERPKARHLIAH